MYEKGLKKTQNKSTETTIMVSHGRRAECQVRLGYKTPQITPAHTNPTASTAQISSQTKSD